MVWRFLPIGGLDWWFGGLVDWWFGGLVVLASFHVFSARTNPPATKANHNVPSILWIDEIHFAPPKKPWNDESPVNTNKQWFPNGAGFRPSTWVFTGQEFGGQHLDGLQPLGFGQFLVVPQGSRCFLGKSSKWVVFKGP